MTAHLVGNMGQVGGTGRHPITDMQRFVQREMRQVMFFSQGVDNQRIHSFDLFELAVVDAVHVGQVGEPADPESENGQLIMYAADRNDFGVADPKRSVRQNRMQPDLGNPRVGVFGKRIVEILFHPPLHPLFGINIDWLAGNVIESAHVVQPGYMIFVFVCQQDAVELTDRFAEHLLPEIRPSID